MKIIKEISWASLTRKYPQEKIKPPTCSPKKKRPIYPQTTSQKFWPNRCFQGSHDRDRHSLRNRTNNFSSSNLMLIMTNRKMKSTNTSTLSIRTLSRLMISLNLKTATYRVVILLIATKSVKVSEDLTAKVNVLWVLAVKSPGSSSQLNLWMSDAIVNYSST